MTTSQSKVPINALARNVPAASVVSLRTDVKFMADEQLLTRDQFRKDVFARDKHKCVICGVVGQDAHHIMERRLFPDGGYYLSNGATVCAYHHMLAEQTILGVEALRIAIQVTHPALPPGYYPDEIYDKWGNFVLPNGMRTRGELFFDESVRKALLPALHFFTNRFKYPRTFHLPWSPGITSDDRVLSQATVESWRGQEVVITEKMDGENTTMYKDYIHARSIEYEPRFDRDRVKAFHARIGWQLDEGLRICGENLTATHSIRYENLPHYFMIFGIWNNNICLSWKDTTELAETLGIPTVPVLWQGRWDEFVPDIQHDFMNFAKQEGYVVRPAEAFTLREYSTRVGKYVRKGHVQETHGHWTRRRVEYNGIVEGVK